MFRWTGFSTLILVIAVLLLLNRLTPHSFSFGHTKVTWPSMENNVLTNDHIDVLTATAPQLQQGLRNGSLTSAMIVQAYLAQIKRHNHADANLNAMISVPESQILLSTARSLDAERSAGQVRGPLHGIPIIIKAAITTSPELGMGTTGGSYALEESIPVGNAGFVDAVRSSFILSDFRPIKLIEDAVDKTWAYHTWESKPLCKKALDPFTES